jgi:hypothetical protein
MTPARPLAGALATTLLLTASTGTTVRPLPSVAGWASLRPASSALVAARAGFTATGELFATPGAALWTSGETIRGAVITAWPWASKTALPIGALHRFGPLDRARAHGDDRHPPG